MSAVEEQLSELTVLPQPNKEALPYSIALDVVRFHLCQMKQPLPDNLETPVGIPSAEMLKMRFLQQEFRRLYKASFRADSSTLTRAQAYPYFIAVLDEVFSDGVFSWGRVVAVYYFGAEFAQQRIEADQADMVSQIVEWTAAFFEKYLLGWMQENGGWPAFMKEFERPPECDCSFM